MLCRGVQILVWLCLVLASAHYCTGGRFDSAPLTYKNYRLYQIVLESNSGEHISILLSKFMLMRKDTDSMIFLDDVFWPGKVTHVVVAPHKAADFELHIIKLGLKWRVLSENYKYFLDNDAKQVKSKSNTYDWLSYYKLNDTYSFLQRLQNRNPYVERFEIGKSAEGRPIIGAHVTRPDISRRRRSPSETFDLSVDPNVGMVPRFDPNIGIDPRFGPNIALDLRTMQQIIRTITITREKQKAKPTIFVEAGMHGNNWITSAVATYIINELATSNDPAVSMVAKKYHWLILPHANPDGYVYTDEFDPLWSRTRGRHDHCIGVDANRNFDVNWQRSNETIPKCNKNYRGPHAFSEVEAKQLADVLRTGRSSIELYISLHFGKRGSAKFSYGEFSQANNTLLHEINAGLKDNPAPDTYPHGGSSVEWASKMGIKNALNFEVGVTSVAADNIVPGTQVPETAIVSIAKDAMYSLVTLAVTTLPIANMESQLLPSWK